MGNSGPAALICGVSILALGAVVLTLDVIGLLGLMAVIGAVAVGGISVFSVGKSGTK